MIAFSQLQVNLDDIVKTLLSSSQALTRLARWTKLSQSDYVLILTVDSREYLETLFLLMELEL